MLVLKREHCDPCSFLTLQLNFALKALRVFKVKLVGWDTRWHLNTANKDFCLNTQKQSNTSCANMQLIISSK